MAISYKPAFLKRLARHRKRQRWDLTALLNAADVRAPRPYRHLWLIRLAEWIRGTQSSHVGTNWPVRRIRHLLNLLERNPELEQRVASVIGMALTELDDQSLWADFGFAPRSAFLSEFSERMRRHFLPDTPDTIDLGTLLRMTFTQPVDAEWLAALDPATLQRIAAMICRHVDVPTLRPWHRTAIDAIEQLASQVRVSGTSSVMRQRMDDSVQEQRPFHALTEAAERLQQAYQRGEAGVIADSSARLRTVLEQCRHYAETIYQNLDDYGISVDVIFEIHQLRERTRRIDNLLTTLIGAERFTTITQLLADMVRDDQQRRGVRALFAHHYSMLARKVAQRSGEIGEHYITSTRAEFFSMLRKALIGGAVLAVTTFVKFMLAALGMPPFWSGLWAGINYAGSFVAIHLLHGAVATKQPAMTAPALAAKLQHVEDSAGLNEFVAEVAKLIRSQFAGIAGNLLAVTPLVLGIQLIAWQITGAPAISTDKAMHILHDSTLLGPSVFYAAFTGIILFIGSLCGGWTENWFLWHRLDSAIAWNPHSVAFLGSARAQRWSSWWRNNISGMASNISLGLMLGLVPIIAQFFGLPLEVRHVTLVTGQVMAAAGTLGSAALHEPAFWWCLAAIPLIGMFNLIVSFILAFLVAIRSRGIEVKDRQRIARAVLSNLRRRPVDFIYPPRQPDPIDATAPSR